VSIEVVIPSLRQRPAEWLVASLTLQTQPPDVVTVVSNETQPFEVGDVPVRLLRFSSEVYGIGEKDVALRQNVGIYSSECDYIVIQGDDQVAPPSMIADTLQALADAKKKRHDDFIWGNHRLLDWSGKTMEEIRMTPMEDGKSRENPVPPYHHGFWSCYGGMFAAGTGFIQDFGAFDMAFNGRHANEDQQLGFRLSRHKGNDGSSFIVEPPFSWHPMELRNGDVRARSPWLPPISNGCGEGSHSFGEALVKGLKFLSCWNCPYTTYAGEAVSLVERSDVIVRYRPEWVETSSVWLNRRENI
jgi:hypothetical protein